MPQFYAGDQIGIDTAQMSAMARKLKGTDLRKELMKRVRLAAEPVKKAIAEEASWSTRIPAALSVRSSYAAKGAAVKVIVDKTKAPEAAPINNRNREGTFRHPVYGNRQSWVSQPARPFMLKGAQKALPAVAEEVVKVYEDIGRRAGFR